MAATSPGGSRRACAGPRVIWPLIGLLATTVFGLLYRSYNQKVWK